MTMATAVPCTFFFKGGLSPDSAKTWPLCSSWCFVGHRVRIPDYDSYVSCAGALVSQFRFHFQFSPRLTGRMSNLHLKGAQPQKSAP